MRYPLKQCTDCKSRKDCEIIGRLLEVDSKVPEVDISDSFCVRHEPEHVVDTSWKKYTEGAESQSVPAKMLEYLSEILDEAMEDIGEDLYPYEIHMNSETLAMFLDDDNEEVDFFDTNYGRLDVEVNEDIEVGMFGILFGKEEDI